MSRHASAARQPPVPKSERTTWAWLAGTFFGAGFLKPGPGTYGSAAACVLWLVTGWLVHHNTQVLALVTACGVVLATSLGIPAATRVAREADRTDPGFVVIDEVAGQWLALILPWPIRKLEALPEGTGIMVDDLGAGVLALALGQLSVHLMAKLH